MKKNFTHVIGLMSGTSLDGVDLIYVRFDENYNYTILATKTEPYTEELKLQLQNAIGYSKTTLKQIDLDYGRQLALKINNFIAENEIEEVDFIASHGHTVFHQPENGITLQIGDGQKIADITQQKVVCDFRTQDVQLGGQGAPLVPIGDELLFSEYDYCLNLGGFANVSYKKGDKRIAYDICAVNIVLNKYAQQLGLEYDDEGKIAASGTFLAALEADLRCLDFYKELPPKSLGLEWVQKEIFPKLEASKRKPEDLLRTYTDHIAWAIAKEFAEDAKVLVTGGGAFNTYLMNEIKRQKNVNLIIPDVELINFKEALIFALLGLLRVDNQVNCLKSVTGASKNHSSGFIFYPKK